MPEKDTSPVIRLTTGLQYQPLVGYLKEAAEELRKLWEQDPYMSPERALSSVPAYRAALATELLFSGEGKVTTWDFGNRLAPNRPFDAANFTQACVEVQAFLDANRFGL